MSATERSGARASPTSTERGGSMRSSRIRAVTLWQPWATLVALGVKTIETRSWAAPEDAIGNRIVIHAATRNPWVHGPSEVGSWVVGTDGSPQIRDRAAEGLVVHRLPLGAVVASGVLAACVPMVKAGSVSWDEAADVHRTGAVVLNLNGPELAYYRAGIPHDELSVDVTNQRPYGDFAPGRWAWLLEDVKPTTSRCPHCWGAVMEPGEIDIGPPGAVMSDLFREQWEQPMHVPCSVCGSTGACDPIPARGRQRVWWWEP